MCRLRGLFGVLLMATMGSSTGRVASILILYEERLADRVGGFGEPNVGYERCYRTWLLSRANSPLTGDRGMRYSRPILGERCRRAKALVQH